MGEFIFRGSIRNNPLPEALQKINYYKVPGVMTVTAPVGRKKIFISSGEIIFASSSLDEDRLGEYLLSSGNISPEQYDRSVEMMKATGRRQGTMLVESNAIQAHDLFNYVKQQVMAIVWSLFNWTDGEITFKVGKYKDDEIIKLNLDTRAAILLGIKSIKDPRRVVKWLGHKEEIFEPTDFALVLLPSLPLSVEDKQVFRQVDGRKSFIDLLKSSPLESGETVKSLYALYVLGLVKKKSSAVSIIIPSHGREKSR